MKLKKWAVLACTAALAVSVLSGCGNSVSTKTETVSKSDHPVALTLDANITALHMTNIVPKLSGKLVSTPLAVGQEVKAGEVVVDRVRLEAFERIGRRLGPLPDVADHVKERAVREGGDRAGRDRKSVV